MALRAGWTWLPCNDVELRFVLGHTVTTCTQEESSLKRLTASTRANVPYSLTQKVRVRNVHTHCQVLSLPWLPNVPILARVPHTAGRDVWTVGRGALERWSSSSN